MGHNDCQPHGDHLELRRDCCLNEISMLFRDKEGTDARHS